ncbi:EexN family lipoprotein [Shewanella sp. 202IG2-18]|uniref:EexN family lipoprotein n=1 Tax=Parashewanella hymeniacidonis TaxID=2807618 RepID=UPI00196062F8|nr:EexN family lipoprotein [Parashewanella hymeniacidonis]MBM7073747.1 EexN family lipoprotein [Parashewanella hymeniacidonis]
MKTQYLTIIAIGSLALSACFDSKHEVPATKSTPTVDWYLTHNAELDNTLARCSNNPGEYRNQPDCINALQAANQRSAGELHPLHIDVDKLPKHHGWH